MTSSSTSLKSICTTLVIALAATLHGEIASRNLVRLITAKATGSTYEPAADREPLASREWVRTYVEEAVKDRISGHSVLLEDFGVTMTFGYEAATNPAVRVVSSTIDTCPVGTYWVWDQMSSSYFNRRAPLIQRLDYSIARTPDDTASYGKLTPISTDTWTFMIQGGEMILVRNRLYADRIVLKYSTVSDEEAARAKAAPRLLARSTAPPADQAAALADAGFFKAPNCTCDPDCPGCGGCAEKPSLQGLEITVAFDYNGYEYKAYICDGQSLVPGVSSDGVIDWGDRLEFDTWVSADTWYENISGTGDPDGFNLYDVYHSPKRVGQKVRAVWSALTEEIKETYEGWVASAKCTCPPKDTHACHLLGDPGDDCFRGVDDICEYVYASYRGTKRAGDICGHDLGHVMTTVGEKSGWTCEGCNNPLCSYYIGTKKAKHPTDGWEAPSDRKDHTPTYEIKVDSTISGESLIRLSFTCACDNKSASPYTTHQCRCGLVTASHKFGAKTVVITITDPPETESVIEEGNHITFTIFERKCRTCGWVDHTCETKETHEGGVDCVLFEDGEEQFDFDSEDCCMHINPETGYACGYHWGHIRKALTDDDDTCWVCKNELCPNSDEGNAFSHSVGAYVFKDEGHYCRCGKQWIETHDLELAESSASSTGYVLKCRTEGCTYETEDSHSCTNEGADIDECSQYRSVNCRCLSPGHDHTLDPEHILPDFAPGECHRLCQNSRCKQYKIWAHDGVAAIWKTGGKGEAVTYVHACQCRRESNARQSGYIYKTHCWSLSDVFYGENGAAFAVYTCDSCDGYRIDEIKDEEDDEPEEPTEPDDPSDSDEQEKPGEPEKPTQDDIVRYCSHRMLVAGRIGKDEKWIDLHLHCVCQKCGHRYESHEWGDSGADNHEGKCREERCQRKGVDLSHPGQLVQCKGIRHVSPHAYGKRHDAECHSCLTYVPPGDYYHGPDELGLERHDTKLPENKSYAAVEERLEGDEEKKSYCREILTCDTEGCALEWQTNYLAHVDTLINDTGASGRDCKCDKCGIIDHHWETDACGNTVCSVHPDTYQGEVSHTEGGNQTYRCFCLCGKRHTAPEAQSDCPALCQACGFPVSMTGISYEVLHAMFLDEAGNPTDALASYHDPMCGSTIKTTVGICRCGRFNSGHVHPNIADDRSYCICICTAETNAPSWKEIPVGSVTSRSVICGSSEDLAYVGAARHGAGSACRGCGESYTVYDHPFKRYCENCMGAAVSHMAEVLTRSEDTHACPDEYNPASWTCECGCTSETCQEPLHLAMMCGCPACLIGDRASCHCENNPFDLYPVTATIYEADSPESVDGRFSIELYSCGSESKLRVDGAPKLRGVPDEATYVFWNAPDDLVYIGASIRSHTNSGAPYNFDTYVSIAVGYEGRVSNSLATFIPHAIIDVDTDDWNIDVPAYKKTIEEMYGIPYTPFTLSPSKQKTVLMTKEEFNAL